jgi:hypothetical protein
VALVVALGPEERVREHNVVDVVERRVVDHVPVDKEEDGQVDLLARPDLLLLEAEALDLGKVRRDLVSAAPCLGGRDRPGHSPRLPPPARPALPALTFSGVMLYVAIPIRSLSELFLAV